MRDYAKIAPQFWTGKTGKAIRQIVQEDELLGLRCRVLAAYLLSSPNANMIGLYYLPIPTMAHETGIPLEGASKALRRLSEGDIGFCSYDEESEFVWIPKMARFQIAETLKEKDNNVAHVKKLLEQAHHTQYVDAFLTRYGEKYNLGNKCDSEAPSDPLRSQEQDQEVEVDLEQESRSGKIVAPKPRKRTPKESTLKWQTPEHTPRGELGLVLLTDAEEEQIRAKAGADGLAWMLRKLEGHLHDTPGYKYHHANVMLRKWVWDAWEEHTAKTRGRGNNGQGSPAEQRQPPTLKELEDAGRI